MAVEPPKASRSFPATATEWATAAPEMIRNAFEIERFVERAAGIEPATLAWKARALPLCNARELGRAGFEPA
jgi:hypothetical protein